MTPTGETMIRYASRSSATRYDHNKFHHVKRLGNLVKVIGYRYESTRKINDKGDRFTTTHEAVKVIGDNGYCRFDSILWGYGGEGPRGLYALLTTGCGVSPGMATSIAYTTRRHDVVGLDWEYHFLSKGLFLRSPGSKALHLPESKLKV